MSRQYITELPEFAQIANRLQQDLAAAPHAIGDRIWLVNKVQELESELRQLRLRESLMSACQSEAAAGTDAAK